MGSEQPPRPSGRVGVAQIRLRDRPLQGDQRGGVAGELDRDAIGPLLHLTGQRVARDRQAEGGEGQSERKCRKRRDPPGPRAGTRRQGSAGLAHEQHAQWRHEGHEQQPAQDVALLDVGELVSDERAQRGALSAGDGVVVEDDPSGLPDPVYVGVESRATARGVYDVDAVDLDPGLGCQPERLVSQFARREPLEVVEERSEQNRPEEGGGDREPRGSSRRGEPPQARQAPLGPDQQRGAESGEPGRDRDRATAVPEPLRHRLRREPRLGGAIVREEGQGQREEGQGDRDRRPRGERTRNRSAAETLKREPGRSGSSERKSTQREELDQQQPDPEHALAGAVGAGLRRHGRVEIGARLHLRRVRARLTRREPDGSGRRDGEGREGRRNHAGARAP